VRHWLHRIKSCLCVPVDPPDTEFDCVGVNGEGSYYTAVVGGASNVAECVYSSCCTVMYSRAECASGRVSKRCQWLMHSYTHTFLMLLALFSSYVLTSRRCAPRRPARSVLFIPIVCVVLGYHSECCKDLALKHFTKMHDVDVVNRSSPLPPTLPW
jgi:hypothetical protein